MGKGRRSQIVLLYVETIEIQLLDIPRTLDELGYTVYKASLGIPAQKFEQKAFERILYSIDNYEIQCAISYDFVPCIAQACYEAGIPYVAWVYDAPQQELYTHYAQYPCNYIFVFDKMQQKRLKEIGLSHVYYSPLAIHADRVQLALQNGEGKTGEYRDDITFVGQLYRKDNLFEIMHRAPQQVKDQMEEAIGSCFLQWDDSAHMHGKMSDESVQYFSELDKHKIPKELPYISEQFYYEAAVLSRLLANRERVTILNSLAEKYQVSFYTFDEQTDQLSDKVKVMPGAKYDYEVSGIYRHSKINLNITLHCIETGASQRIFDVMAAGGFMLSNYQADLAELFVDGEEIVFYHNMEELNAAVAYYLAHDEERKKIARKGQQKVLRQFDFHDRLEAVLRIVSEQEKDRTETYITLQRSRITELAQEYLQEETMEAYGKLYDFLTKKQYETVLRKTTSLGILREVVECWDVFERKSGTSQFLAGVHTVEQLEYKYSSVKHIMWRIEQGVSRQNCQEAVALLLEQEIPSWFIVWVVYANLCHKEETVIQLSDYVREYDLAKSLEILSFAQVLFPGKDAIHLKKADCLMDLSMWREALETLRKIEQPGGEIVSLIEELTALLH